MNVNGPFSIDILKKNILEIEKTEQQIWSYHKNDNLRDLFLLCLERTTKIEDNTSLFKHQNSDMAQLLQEILEKYTEVKEVVFENNYHKILICLEELLLISSKQTDKLNISNVLIDKEIREETLNGNKLKDYESEFTSVCKNVLREINNSCELTINDEENSKKYLEESQAMTSEDIDESQIVIEHEVLNDIVDMETLKDTTVDVNIEVEEKKSESDNPTPKKLEDSLEAKQVFSHNLKEKSYFIDKSKLEDTQTSEDIKRIIKEYFSYQDSPSISDEEKKEIITKSVNSKSAQKYAKILLELEQNDEFEIYEMLGRKIFAQTLTLLQEIDIEPLSYSMSQTWVMWDIAKQLHYIKNPLESNNNYVLENPLESENKQKEIIYRHLGWIIYKEMTSGRLDTLLANVKNSSYAKKIIDYMIDKPNKGGSLSSYKLADLGKSVILALKK